MHGMEGYSILIAIKIVLLYLKSGDLALNHGQADNRNVTRNISTTEITSKYNQSDSTTMYTKVDFYDKGHLRSLCKTDEYRSLKTNTTSQNVILLTI